MLTESALPLRRKVISISGLLPLKVTSSHLQRDLEP